MSNYDEKAVCHDHFDGSAHCVECGGPCRLTGSEMAYTALVRSVFDCAAFCGQIPPHSMMQQLIRSGIDAKKLWNRASGSMFAKSARKVYT